MEALIAHQELFLRILSFLDSPADLTKVQGVGRYWQRMALDPQLWKRLYLSKYPHPHHSKLVYNATHTPAGSSTPLARNDDLSFSTPRPLRPIARLPSRAFPPPSPSRSPSASALRPGTGTATPLAPPSGPSAGVGHAIPLSRREAAELALEEVGSGVRNDGVRLEDDDETGHELCAKLESSGPSAQGPESPFAPKASRRARARKSRGNASSQSTITLPPSPSPSITSDLPHETPTRSQAQNTGTEQHIALSPSFIFTSNPTSPLVHVYAASHGRSPSTRLGIIPPPPGWSSPSRPDNITAIAADQTVPEADDGEDVGTGSKRDLPVRLAVFYQSGGYVVLSIRTTEAGALKSLVWAREAILPPTSRHRRRTTTYAPRMGDPVVLAVLHHPVLITCTQGFQVSVYTLPSPASTNPAQPNHLSTLHSDVSYHPAALSLFPNSLTGESSFRASLTYCTPVYPSSWTIAAQEFDISLSPAAAEGQVHRAECYNVGSGPDDSEDEEIVWPRRVKPVIGVKGRAGGIGTDGRWCILSGGDNQIQVYALPGSGLATPPPSPPFGHPGKRRRMEGDGNIVHSQTLLAHFAKVTSVSLSAGRCVSGGNDGRVLVWNLDDESGEEGRVGRTVGYVEVRTGEERVWRGAAGPREAPSPEDRHEGEASTSALPHPQAISSAARTFFLPRPPIELELEHEDRTRKNVRAAIRQLAFDEEKIVGLVSGPILGQGRGGEVGEVMKVWSFG